jgi:hypothetical protein
MASSPSKQRRRHRDADLFGGDRHRSGRVAPLMRVDELRSLRRAVGREGRLVQWRETRTVAVTPPARFA